MPKCDTPVREWDLSIKYDYRFGGLTIYPIDPGGKPVAQFTLRVQDLLREMKIPAHELRALAAMAEGQPEPMGDIDTFRRAAIEGCNLKGKTVLDIGGYDGAMAKIALDAGAARAIVLDNHQYEHYGWADKKIEGVEYDTRDVMEWGVDDEYGTPSLMCSKRQRVGVIINYNVLYHLKNPWAFLDKCRAIIQEDGEMVLCTLFRYHDGAWMYVYEPRECNGEDETVYFGPSLTALERMLEATGWDYKRVGLAFDRVVYSCQPTEGFSRSHEDT